MNTNNKTTVLYHYYYMPVTFHSLHGVKTEFAVLYSSADDLHPKVFGMNELVNNSAWFALLITLSISMK